MAGHEHQRRRTLASITLSTSLIYHRAVRLSRRSRSGA